MSRPTVTRASIGIAGGIGAFVYATESGMDFYSDNDRGAAEWLRELIRCGHLPKGRVDERSIEEIDGTALAKYRRVHLFAGIGGWAYALALAGWPRSRPVWTGSCPCQPFSTAGKGEGEADPRHLWPVFFRLIRERRPATLFGEQVSGRDGYGWFAGVRHDLEAEGYAVGCADLPACSEGAPHKRHRLFFVADLPQHGRGQGHPLDGGSNRRVRAARRRVGPADHSGAVELADAGHGQPGQLFGSRPVDGTARRVEAAGQGKAATEPSGRRATGGMADADGRLARDGGLQRGGEHGQQPSDSGTIGIVGNAPGDRRQKHKRRPRAQKESDAPHSNAGPGYWSAFDLIPCRDDKVRRVEPGTFPLAYGLPGRMGLLRGYGNAIVPQVAAAFVRAFLETEQG